MIHLKVFLLRARFVSYRIVAANVLKSATSSSLSLSLCSFKETINLLLKFRLNAAFANNCPIVFVASSVGHRRRHCRRRRHRRRHCRRRHSRCRRHHHCRPCDHLQ